jgi:TatA/E family protein of Tat protein translocase
VLGLGGTELVIIAVFAILIFGPDKIPQLARTIGRFQREFKRAQDTMESTIRAETDFFTGQSDGKGPSSAAASDAGESATGAADSATSDKATMDLSQLAVAMEDDEEEEEEEE